MSLIQPLQFRIWEMPHFEMPHLQIAIFQMLVTVAKLVCGEEQTEGFPVEKLNWVDWWPHSHYQHSGLDKDYRAHLWVDLRIWYGIKSRKGILGIFYVGLLADKTIFLVLKFISRTMYGFIFSRSLIWNRSQVAQWAKRRWKMAKNCFWRDDNFLFGVICGQNNLPNTKIHI